MASPSVAPPPRPALPLTRSHIPHSGLGASLSRFLRVLVPVLLFAITLFTTSVVGSGYMLRFRTGQSPAFNDPDLFPFSFALHSLRSLALGLPFSATLILILLTHEFAHYFACRRFRVACTLPYLLPAPSLSGTFGAVIRLTGPIRSRAALIVIGSSGPIAGFTVALAAAALGLALSISAPGPLGAVIQAPLALSLASLFTRTPALASIVPHPVLIASWIGLLITALNLIPAGQLDGGHIVYGISPAAHRLSSRVVTLVLILLGLFCWGGWLLWAAILQMPFMRHPAVFDRTPLPRSISALVPVSALVLVLSATLAPFRGYSIVALVREFGPHLH